MDSKDPPASAARAPFIDVCNISRRPEQVCGSGGMVMTVPPRVGCFRLGPFMWSRYRSTRPERGLICSMRD